MPSVVTINGRRIEVEGNSISVTNGVLFVDGEVWTDEAGGKCDSGKVLKIELTGDLLSLKCDRSVEVSGGVGGDVDAGGSVTVKSDVNGNVRASGSVHCGNVGGYANVSGSLHCGNVGGNVEASGSVKCGPVAGSVRGTIVKHG